MNTSETEQRNIDSLPPWFRALPVGQAMLEEQRREIATIRRGAIAEVAAAEADMVKLLPPLDNAIEESEKAAEAAERELRASVSALYGARNARLSAAHAFERRRDRAHHVLRRTTPRVILQFLADMAKERQDLMATDHTMSAAPPTGRWSFKGGAEKEIYSKMPSVNRRLDAILEIIKNNGDDLRFACVSEEAAEQKVRELRAALPEIKTELVRTT